MQRNGVASINEIMGINVRIRWSSEFELLDGPTERLLGICKQCKATEYVRGPKAKGYFDTDLAKKRKHKSFMDGLWWI